MASQRLLWVTSEMDFANCTEAAGSPKELVTRAVPLIAADLREQGRTGNLWFGWIIDGHANSTGAEQEQAQWHLGDVDGQKLFSLVYHEIFNHMRSEAARRANMDQRRYMRPREVKMNKVRSLHHVILEYTQPPWA